MINYRWDGNIRQLKNIAEQLSVLEEDRSISNKTLKNYLPKGADSSLPAIISGKENSNDFNSEREILYKVLFDMKGDLNDLKKLTNKQKYSFVINLNLIPISKNLKIYLKKNNKKSLNFISSQSFLKSASHLTSAFF